MIAEEIEKIEEKKKAETMQSNLETQVLPASSNNANSVKFLITASSDNSSKAVDHAPSQGKRTVELTIHEIQTLAEIAKGSSLHRDKAELQLLQAAIEALIVSVQSSGDVEKSPLSHTVPLNDETATRSLQRLQSVLQSLLSKLQVTMTSSESMVADRFNLLDRNEDGHISAEELRDAIVRLLRQNFSLQEAQQLVSILDSDQDGKGT
jgi:DNA primase large subunit